MLTAILLAAALPQGQAIELYRVWKPKTTLTYQVRSHLYVEERDYTTSVYIPATQTQTYEYTMQVGELGHDGFASVIYKKPKVTVVQGETAERASVTTVENVGEHYELRMSPVNAITDLKDLSPKKKEGDGGLRLLRTAPPMSPAVQDVVGNFLGELYRLALFIGNAETSVDFGPRLPVLEVEPGDTWEITASYQPQKLKGKEGKMATQRLDYTYTYIGVVEVDGKKLHRVSAALNFDNDIAPFINDMLGMKPSESGLRGLKLKMDAKMEFDLDYETRNTVAIRADSVGAMSILITELPDVPYMEQNIKGRTRLKLLSIK